MNWLDAAIVLVIMLFAWLGARQGLVIGLLELAGLLLSIAIPLFTYIPVSSLLVRWGVPRVYAGALAFLVIWIIVANAYYFAARRLYRRLPGGVRRSRTNRLLGMIPGIARGLILVTLLLAFVTTLPSPILSDRTLDGSLLAQPLLKSAVVVTTYATDIFGEAVQEALGFLTIRPESTEVVHLPFTVADPAIDPSAESEMLRLLNRERESRGLRPLTMDPTITAVARQHSVDMYRRGYFSHETPEGRTPFDRMRGGGVRFALAGENLAFARNVEIAHTGLMRSPGHRANILRPQFRRVGIGAASNRRYGMMFTQNFAN